MCNILSAIKVTEQLSKYLTSETKKGMCLHIPLVVLIVLSLILFKNSLCTIGQDNDRSGQNTYILDDQTTRTCK